MPYVSELLGTAVWEEGRRLGRVRDVLATAGPLPAVSAVVVDGRRIAWRSLQPRGGRLESRPAPGGGPGGGCDEVSLAGLLDRQILDARGFKVVRVNDVRLEEVGGELRVVGVDVGVRGYLRRLGLERLALWLAHLLGYQMPEAIIPWAFVASLEGGEGVRLGVDRELLSRLRPVEVAELLEALEPEDRIRVLRVMDNLVLARALGEASPEVQERTLDELGEVRASAVLRLMAPDEAVDVLGALPAAAAERLLSLLPSGDQRTLRSLLGYHPRSAGGLMTPQLVALRTTLTAEEAIAELRRLAPSAESIYYVYAVDEGGVLRGVVPLRDLLTAPPQTPVEAIMRREVVQVGVDDPEETVAEVMERYDLLALPVVDPEGRLRGIITVDDVMRAVSERAASSLGALSGAGEQADLLASGRLGTLAWSIAAGLVASLALLEAGAPRGTWLAAAALPLLLRLAQDQGAWALASRLEEERRLGGRLLAAEPAAAALAATPVALLLGAAAVAAGDRRLGVALAAAVVASCAAAALLGVLLAGVLSAAGRRWLVRKGRVVPLGAALGGLAAYLGMLSGWRR